MADINRVIRMTLGLDNQGKETADMDIRSLFSTFKDNIVRLFVSDVKVADNKITVTKGGSTSSYDLPSGMTIDSELSDTSTNPVQNKVVKAAIPTKVSQLSNDSGFISEVTWDDVAGKPSTFAPSAHNQASNTITAMTGYAKPDATSAIVSSDSLNSAVGKLEKSLDGKAAKATTLSGYGITDAYTKTETDAELAKKQDVISDLATIRTNASTGAGLSTQVSTNKTNIASLQTALGGYLPLSGGTITGDILPSTDNAVTLGSDTKRFKEIYAHEVKLSTNSLYLGDTKILGTDANTINIKADAGQSLALKSQGSGVTNVQSFTGVSIETVAENGTNPDGSNIKIKALGDGSSITMIAPSIGITGATTVTNLNVTGNLSVAGTTTTVNSTNLEIKDNIIEINKGETGAGVTAGTAGVKIDRGDNTDFFVVFDESDDKLKVGIGNENLTPVATESYVDTGLSGKLDTNANAVSASKLTKNAGSATQPVYFSNGVPVATTYTLGASVPSNAKFTDTTYSNATTSASGLMSASDKSKLDGVASGAEINQNAFSNITVGSTTVSADSKTDTLTLVAGSNVTLTPDATNDKITIAAKDTTYSNATTSKAGLMSTSDKSKLDGVASGAEVNQNAFSNVVIGDATIAADAKTDTLTLVAGSNVTLTADATNDKITIAAKDTTYGTATSSTLGLVKTGSNITNSSGTISITKDNVTSALGYTPPTTNTTYDVATTSANGLMSSTDKSKLDGIAANANNYSLPTATDTVLGGVKVGSNITNSSGTISLTKANVTSALGYTPPTTDTNTHYTTHAKVGASATATANAAASNGSVYLNILDDSTVRDSHLIKGAGATTVTSDANGVITISSTDTNTNTTYSAGAGISLSGTTFSNSGVRSIATGGSNGTISVNTNGTSANVAVKGLGSAAYTASSAYAAASHTHPQDNNFIAYGNEFNFIPTLTANMDLHFNYRQTGGNNTSGYKIANYHFNNGAGSTDGVTLIAGTFNGALSGNAATATKATQDSAGQQINTTYIKGLSVSGKTITYTKGNGTTGTITTQDTVYTHPTTSGNKHIPSGGSSGQILRWSADGTAAWGADTNTWRGIQNNLTSDSTTDSLSAAQGKALKALVDGKAASSHTHNSVLDSGNNSSATTFAYSKAGLDTTSWFAAWNGYELRAISPAKTLSTIGAAASSHTHNYAGSSSAGGAATSANKVANALTISLNGTSQGAYDGSAAKSINITASSIGAAASSHTHSYASVTKVTFTASDSKWGSASGGFYPLTLANSGKNLFAVYRANGSNYDRVEVSDTVSGSNNIIYSLEKFAGYALFI